MTTGARVAAEVCPRLGKIGAAFYFTPETLARGRELGLDGYRFYFLGRGGMLGDVEAPVVASAFGYFEPGLVAHMWDTARQKLAPRAAGAEYLACAHRFGRERFAGIEGLHVFCRAAEAVAHAADLGALALFAAVMGEPLPDDEPARAMHLAVALRELRGSVHLVAVRASGLTGRQAHFLKRPDDFELFGWKEHQVPEVTDEHRRAKQAADTLTDELVAPAYAAIDDADAPAFIAAVQAMERAL